MLIGLHIWGAYSGGLVHGGRIDEILRYVEFFCKNMEKLGNATYVQLKHVQFVLLFSYVAHTLAKKFLKSSSKNLRNCLQVKLFKLSEFKRINYFLFLLQSSEKYDDFRGNMATIHNEILKNTLIGEPALDYWVGLSLQLC